MTPRPLKFPSPIGEGFLPCKRPSAERGVRPWGRGGVSVFLPTQHLLCSPVSCLNITDPTPIPSPTGAGSHCGRLF